MSVYYTELNSCYIEQMVQAATSPQSTPGRVERFFSNVLWSELAVGINIAVGVLLSPYIIHKLGAEGYGIWALLFSVVGYYALLDLGFRSAAVRFSAHYRGKEEYDKINEVINTGLVYFSGTSVLLVGATLYLWKSAHLFFKISPGYQHDFSILILLIGTACAVSMIFSLFGGCLEGFQRFDVTSRIASSTILLRSVGCAVVLATGHGLVAIGVIAFCSQLLGHFLTYVGLRKSFPRLRLSFARARFAMFKQLAHYGLHTFVASVASMLLNFGYPLLIGHFLPVAFVGYYTLPVRLLQYTSEATSQVGLITAANAAELQAKGHMESVSRLGIYANRYCFTLYVPFAIVVAVYGRQILERWVGVSFAAQAAPVLPVLLLGALIAQVGQFNSSTILFGLAQHQKYAIGLLAEATVAIGLGILVVPRYGIVGAAWVSALAMIAIRGLYTPWLVCRSLHFSFARYLGAIFVRPVLTSIPGIAVAYWCKAKFIPGRTLPELLMVSVIVSVVYVAIAWFTCVIPEHRVLIASRLLKLLKRPQRVEA